jgi:hypothetical protein
LFRATTNVIGIATAGSERLRIDATGKVGIGTTSPQTLFDVVGGSITARGSSATALTSIEAQSNTYYSGPSYQASFIGQNGASATGTTAGISNAGLGVLAFQNGTAGLIYTNGGTDIIVGTSNAERMRITSGGSVGIGATPSYRLHVVRSSGVANVTCIQSDVTGDVSTAALLVVKKDNNTTTSHAMVQFLVNGGVSGQGQINANGALQAAFGSYSDERLKENINSLPSQLANIMSLRPVEFDYKNNLGHQIGFIAQEVQVIYPDLVGTSNDGYLTLTGLGRNEARMIKAFQEFATQMQTKLTEYEQRIAALEN